MQTPSSDLKSVLETAHSKWCGLGLTDTDLRLHAPFWENVFASHYKEPPLDNNDPRWDDLFKQGFPILRALEA